MRSDRRAEASRHFSRLRRTQICYSYRAYSSDCTSTYGLGKIHLDANIKLLHISTPACRYQGLV
jgi:hypothetical protein